MLQQKRAK